MEKKDWRPKAPSRFERALASTFKRQANGSKWTEARQPKEPAPRRIELDPEG